jgi:hypothetical protein
MNYIQFVHGNTMTKIELHNVGALCTKCFYFISYLVSVKMQMSK